MSEKTIFAPMTPLFVSAVGVIRVSGDKTFEIIEKIFSKSLKGEKSHTVHHGYIKDEDKIIDDVVVSIYRAPHSYTGEDVAEISCHGSLYVLSAVQKLLLKNGAFLAEGGEFSKRAFINGKMDMVQAEAVIDLIESESEKEASLALNQIKGSLSEKTEGVRKSLIDLASQLLAYVDYPDDEIEELSDEKIRNEIKKNFEILSFLEKSYENGKLIKNGIKVCITGKPNVGKSCLMNRLSGYERSIVTDIAGTTRDIIEETVQLEGVKLRLYDTAGIREGHDIVEKIGVEKAEEAINKADIVLCLFDISRPFDEDDEKVLSLLNKIKAKKVAVINKNDKKKVLDISKLSGFDKTVIISIKEDNGVESIEKVFSEIFAENYAFDNKDLIMNARQYKCILGAKEALLHAVNNIMLTPDVLLIDIENAVENLSVMTGKSVNEEIIENIFSRFCVGK